MRIRPLVAGLFLFPLMATLSTTPAHAIHFYRGTGGMCSATDGATTDDTQDSGPLAATVTVGHNTFNDTPTGFDVMPAVVHVKAGQSVTWVWKSAHCHSVQSTDGTLGANFYSGFHYPTAEPESPHVAPGAFDYPVLDQTPTLSFTHTFSTVGTFNYRCEHHASIGMLGTVIVAAA